MTAAREPNRVEPSSALYARLLGPAWLDLHPAIRSLHLTAGAATGRFEVLHGRGVAARLARWVLRLPSSATALGVRLTIDRDADSERWTRAFGRRLLVTTQRGLPDGSLAERFGALEFRFRLWVVGDSLTYMQAGAAVALGRLRVPLPRWMSPGVAAREACVDGRGPHVQVRISMPLIGLMTSYEGCIQREPP